MYKTIFLILAFTFSSLSIAATKTDAEKFSELLKMDAYVPIDSGGGPQTHYMERSYNFLLSHSGVIPTDEDMRYLARGVSMVRDKAKHWYLEFYMPPQCYSRTNSIAYMRLMALAELAMTLRGELPEKYKAMQTWSIH